MLHGRLAIIGGGNMGSALLAGALRAGVVNAGQVIVAEPESARRERCAALGVRCVASAEQAMTGFAPADAVLLAVKPQVFAQVALHLAGSPALVVSIMAGVTIERLEEAVRGTTNGVMPRVVRVMPNLGAQVGQGMSALAVGRGATVEDRAFVDALLGAVGHVAALPEELMDAFTAVAGSGPAYVFILAEAMEQAAAALGIDAATARAVVRQTIAGSAALLSASTDSPQDLRRAVTSKGGTTAAACGVPEEAGFVALFERALRAARDRGRELSAVKRP